MSRGLGPVQRRLIAILRQDQRVVDTFELAARAYNLCPDEQGHIMLSHSQAVAVRRALRALVNKGLIADLGRHWEDRRQRWATKERAHQYNEWRRNVFGAESDRTG